MGECFQWKAHGQCSKGDSCSFSHDGASGNRCDQRQKKDSRPLLRQMRRHSLTERNHQKVQALEEKVLLEKEAELRAEASLGESVRIRRVIVGTLPCVKITSLNPDARMVKNVNSDMLRLMGSPVKSRKKWCERSVALLYTIGLCVSRLPSEQFYSTERKKIGIESRRQILQRERGTTLKFGKEWVHREELSQSVRLMSAIRALPDLRKERRNRARREMRPQSSMGGTWRKGSTSSKKYRKKATFYSSIEARAMLAPISKIPEEREFVVDSGASVHMLSKKVLSSAELETLRKSRNPTTDGNGQW